MNLVPPVLGENMPAQQKKLSEEEDREYKVKYRELKRTLKNAVSRNEYLKSELRHSQKKLQYVEEDKHFLLERLLNFEKPPLSPQQTPDLSDSDAESTTPNKKSKSGVSPVHPGGVTFSSAFSKLRPPFLLQKQKRKSRKGRGGGNIGGPDFLDSPVGLSLDSEDSSSFALGGLAPYPPPEEEEEEEEEDEDSD